MYVFQKTNIFKFCFIQIFQNIAATVNYCGTDLLPVNTNYKYTLDKHVIKTKWYYNVKSKF